MTGELKSAGYNRWLVILGTALVQLGVGTFYAWSIFNTPILKMFGELALDKQGHVAAVQPHLGSVSLIFSIGSLTLALSTIVVGRLVKRFGVRRITVVAGLVFGLSAFIVAQLHSPSQLWLLAQLTGLLTWQRCQTQLSGFLKKQGLSQEFRSPFMGWGRLSLNTSMPPS